MFFAIATFLFVVAFYGAWSLYRDATREPVVVRTDE